MTFISRARGLAAGFLALALGLASPALAAESATSTTTNPSLPTVQPLPQAPATLPLVQPLPGSYPAASAPKILPAVPDLAGAQRLHDLVIAWVDYGKQDAEQDCLAGAIYFEARGEPLEGQLAVAQVVLNRVRSGIYPPTICAVVTQPAQFSFIRAGKFPPIDRQSENWHKAMAVADIAQKALIQEVADDVLWYHADYVSPGWGQRLVRATQIGRHIFYQRG